MSPLIKAARRELDRLPPKVPEAALAAVCTLFVIWWLGSLVCFLAAGIAAGYVLGRK